MEMSLIFDKKIKLIFFAYYEYNDATESSAPELTSIDTLYEKLAPFNDENYQVDDGYKMILVS